MNIVGKGFAILHATCENISGTYRSVTRMSTGLWVLSPGQFADGHSRYDETAGFEPTNAMGRTERSQRRPSYFTAPKAPLARFAARSFHCEANGETRGWGRHDPFGKPSANDRHVRTEAYGSGVTTRSWE